MTPSRDKLREALVAAGGARHDYEQRRVRRAVVGFLRAQAHRGSSNLRLIDACGVGYGIETFAIELVQTSQN